MERHSKELPDSVVAELKPGDLLFVGTTDLRVPGSSCFTNSEVSHTAMYIGSRRIVHSKPPEGAVEETIETLFGPHRRLLACACNLSEQKRQFLQSEADDIRSWANAYGWWSVIRTALEIIMGQHYRSFRWAFPADITVLLVVVDFFLMRVHYYNHPVFIWGLLLYLLIVSFNLSGAWFALSKVDESPFLGTFASIRAAGALVILDERINQNPPKWKAKYPDLTRLTSEERKRRLVRRRVNEWLVYLVMAVVALATVASAIGGVIWLVFRYGLRVIAAGAAIAALIGIISYILRLRPSARFNAGESARERGDYVAAIKHWRPLAEGGNVDAQAALGNLYGAGPAVKGDAVRVLLSALLGDVGTRQEIRRDWAKAREWWLLAAKQGHAQASYNLGILYKHGDGVPRDVAQAYMWLSVAERKGWLRAGRALAKLKNEMTAAQIGDGDRLLQKWCG
jgi:hypothetical protein